MNTRGIAEEYRLAHWAQIMQERAESGLSIRAFCKQAGFHENNYFYWQRKLREATCEELSSIQGRTAGLATQGFIEVKIKQQDTFRSAEGPDQGRVSIEASGVRISAGSGYPADKLAYLLREVMQQC